MWKAKLCLGIMGLAPTVPEEIKLFSDAGFDGFFTGWSEGVDFASYRKAADECGMYWQSVHAPFLKAKDMWTVGEKADAAVDELIKCVRYSASVGVPIVILHPFIGFEDHTPTEAGLINYGKVVSEAKKLGVKLAIENTEGEEYLAALMEHFKDDDTVGFCLDTGHQMCYNHSKDMLSLYGDKLIAMHLNDNLGIKDYDGKIIWTDDLHLLPFDGIADWESIAAGLRKYGNDLPLTFELTRKSKPRRHENDVYQKMTETEYLCEAYKRACRVAALKVFGK